MSEAIVQRQLALLLVALVTLVGALAASELAGGSSGDDESTLPTFVPSDGGWYSALAAPYRVDGSAQLTACGQPAKETTPGVAHPVLPCGAKVVIRYGDVEVRTQVVDRGTGKPGREFELTTALAAQVGMRGVEPIEWRFAAR